MSRRICVIVGSRANYASIKSAMVAIDAHPDLELQVVAAASALLDRYGTAADVVRADGFDILAEVHMLIEGETPLTMAKSTGLGLIELPTVLAMLKPDVVLTVGDRFETMATTLAATYMNIPLAHTMGGEVSGNIDDSIRHAITKFAHVHFPACDDAAERIVRLGEDPARIHQVGCPRIDLAATVVADADLGVLQKVVADNGVGQVVDISHPFLLVSQHPVTTEYGDGEAQMAATLEAVVATGIPAIGLWPNADAGAEDVSKAIRKLRERDRDVPLRMLKNLPPEQYLPLMARTACVIGNSSSAIREGPYLGAPAVNIGTRQRGRQRGANVIDVGYDAAEIERAIRAQVAHGPYPSEPIYGDGQAGVRIADVLANADIELVKTQA